MKKVALLLLVFALVMSCFHVVMAEEAPEVKTFTLLASVDADDPDWNDYWFFWYIEKKLGIKFDITQVSAESYAEKQQLAFATNQLPDLLVGAISDADVAMYGDQGLIIPLEDYINAEDTPVIQAWFDLIDGYKTALTYPDGHIYDLRSFQIIDRELPTQRYWINSAWCEQAIGKLPETVDEYYEYLKYVKENDMDGDGDPSNEVPLGARFTTFNKTKACYYDAIKPTIFAFGLTERTLEFVDGKVQYNPTMPAFKEFMKYMNKLYAEGLLDNSYFTQTDDQYKAKIAGNTVGAFNDWACWLNIADDAVWTKYTSNKPMTSEVNDTLMWGGRDLFLDRHFIITSACKDPATLLKIADFTMVDQYDGPDKEISEERKAIVGDKEDIVLDDDEPGRLSQWRGAKLGTWDAHPDWGWEWAEQTDEMGTYMAIATVRPQDEYKNDNDFWNSVMTPNCFPISNIVLDRQSTARENQLTVQVAEYNTPYLHVGWSDNIKLTADEADEASLLEVDIESYLDQMYAKFVTGELDVDAEFDNFVNGLNQRGLERYVEIYQTAYERWLNA